MKRYLYSIYIVIFVFSYSLCNANTRVITVGVFDYYPSLFKNEQGEIDGYYKEAFKEIERQEKIHFVYKYCSRSECIELMELGVIDIVPNIAFDTSFAKRFIYSNQNLTTIWGELYVAQNSKINTIEDITNKTIACLPHDITDMKIIELISKFGISFQLLYCNSYDEVFQKVRTSQVDAGLVTNIFGAMKQEDYSVRPTDIVFNPYCQVSQGCL
jgi:ABC-type amino acid transport substrate-binding protein